MSNVTIGALSIALGTAAALTGIGVVALGMAGRRPTWWRDARWLVGVMMGSSLAAFLVMERALITRDFTVAFVAENGSSRTPPLFNIATL